MKLTDAEISTLRNKTGNWMHFARAIEAAVLEKLGKVDVEPVEKSESVVTKLASQAAEIERLETKLIECRSSVKFHCNDYDRFMLRKEPHANRCDYDEQKRLHDLLDWIDSLENKHD